MHKTSYTFILIFEYLFLTVYDSKSIYIWSCIYHVYSYMTIYKAVGKAALLSNAI